MHRWAVPAIATAFTASMAVAMGACGLDSEGTAAGSVDASPDTFVADAGRTDTGGSDGAVDASGDGAAVDANDGGNSSDAPSDAPCIALTCNGVCVNTCNGCAAGNVACLSSRVCGDCSTCPGSPVACFACTGGVPAGTCQPNASGPTCPGTTQAGACACAGGDAGECPGKNQICTGGGNAACKSCGAGGTDNKQCANGKDCNEPTGICNQ